MTAPSTSAEPTARVGPRWLVGLSLAVGATFVGWYGPLQILLARQAQDIAPDGKEALLAVVAGAGAVVSMVANPLWGALSDRTPARFAARHGRRAPWVLLGSTTGALALLLLGLADGVAWLILGWCLVQLVLNASLAALTAAVPDLVPTAQRGAAGGWIGVATIVGVVAGTGLAIAGIGFAGTFGGYLLCAAVVLLVSVPFLRWHGGATAAEPTPAGPVLRGLWISPRAHPDFGWAWLTRFLMNLGNALSLLYLLYFLTDEVRVADPEGGVLLLTGINAVAVLATVLATGVWSDRSGRRRVFVTWSGVLMAAAAVLLAVAPVWPVVVLAAVVLGIGFGTYTSVDFALITQVLPTASDRGKDLGVINIANTLPQVLAPVFAGLTVSALGGYPALYATAAVVALAGAVLVYRIRSVR